MALNTKKRYITPITEREREELDREKEIVYRTTRSEQPVAEKKDAPQTPPNAEDPGYDRKPPETPATEEPEKKDEPEANAGPKFEPEITTTGKGQSPAWLQAVKDYWWIAAIVLAYILFFRKKTKS